MLSDDKIIFITFLLAIIGYTGLTITLLLSIKRKIPYLFCRIVTLIILVHVIMVWVFHYNLNFSVAVRNGYSGFIIFHSALLIILVSNFVNETLAKNLLRISFVVVTIGAVGATFRYDIVSIYKIPVLICAVAGSAGLLFLFYQKRKN